MGSRGQSSRRGSEGRGQEIGVRIRAMGSGQAVPVGSPGPDYGLSVRGGGPQHVVQDLPYVKEGGVHAAVAVG